MEYVRHDLESPNFYVSFVQEKTKKMHKLISLKIDFDLSESLPIY